MVITIIATAITEVIMSVTFIITNNNILPPLSSSPSPQVSYEDGDSEDMSEDELRKVMTWWHGCGRPRPQLNKQPRSTLLLSSDRDIQTYREIQTVTPTGTTRKRGVSRGARGARGARGGNDGTAKARSARAKGVELVTKGSGDESQKRGAAGRGRGGRAVGEGHGDSDASAGASESASESESGIKTDSESESGGKDEDVRRSKGGKRGGGRGGGGKGVRARARVKRGGDA